MLSTLPIFLVAIKINLPRRMVWWKAGNVLKLTNHKNFDFEMSELNTKPSTVEGADCIILSLICVCVQSTCCAVLRQLLQKQ